MRRAACCRPIIFSEINATHAGNETGVTDSPYIGPWLADIIRATAGLVHLMSSWTFAGRFEEQG
jgi:xylan 1,4-beta-xylosidase